jgi:GTP-binding protein LepA
MDRIRNFSIIAHIDHGKSTLADRMLEITGTVERRKMVAQVLDSMELEREKGITIKMRPVRMDYEHAGKKWQLNLIDTPGHIDFSYEVSRALKAVEGAVLLVDATQGVQAQTLTTLRAARDAGLVILGAVSKCDSPIARPDEVKLEVAKLLGCDVSEVMETSGKTGAGVEALLQRLIEKVPPPVEETPNSGSLRALIFDFQYSNHKGVIVYVRIVDGSVKKGEKLHFSVSGRDFFALEVGVFRPDEVPTDELKAGETGYIVTGVKESGVASVGDTVTLQKKPMPALPGYFSPKPVVWASVYPEDADLFDDLKMALGKLRLSDSSLAFEEETSGTLGRGFRLGCLGLLHLEIITERLKREFNLRLVVATPSITYHVTTRNGEKKIVYSATLFPDHGNFETCQEPWVKAQVLTPADMTGAVVNLLHDHEAELGEVETWADGRVSMTVAMPLRELMRNFFDELKSATSGYASLSYDIEGLRDADVTRMDILVAEEPVEAFTRVVARRRAQEEAEKAVTRLHAVLPKQLFTCKIQARVDGRIIASETLAAMRKDVTGYLYGGDITRKMKLLEKQKKGKKKMAERGKGSVNIPHDVFLKMVKGERG